MLKLGCVVVCHQMLRYRFPSERRLTDTVTDTPHFRGDRESRPSPQHQGNPREMVHGPREVRPVPCRLVRGLRSCDHLRFHWVMDRTANVSELKARMSGYLAKVRCGRSVTIRNRKTPIARLVPIERGLQRVTVREAVDPTALPVGHRIGLNRRIAVVALPCADRAGR